MYFNSALLYRAYIHVLTISFYFLLNNCSSLALRRDWTYVALKASVIIKEGLEIFSNTQPFKCLKQKQFSLEDNMYVKEDNSYSLA